MQVHLKDGLEQAHVGTLVQPNLVLPNIHNEDLTRRKGKKCTLALEILVLTSLTTIGTFHIHHEDVVRHPRAIGRRGIGLLLVLRQPDTLGCLPALHLGHDGELRAEELVEQSGLSGGLRSKHGDEVVVEAGGGDIFEGEVLG